MATAQNKKWALDTNVIMDIGREVDAALSLCEIAKERGYVLYATTTVLEELFHIATKGPVRDRSIASATLSNFQKLGIIPLTLVSKSGAISFEFSKLLRDNKALPESEVNDGIILAEASLANAALLVSSDSHLVSIEPDELWIYFEARDLKPIPVTTPNKVLRFFEKFDRITGRY